MNWIFNRSVYFLSIISLFVLSSPSIAAIDATTILKSADEVRNPSNSYLMKVSVHNSDASIKDSLFEVYIKGNNQTLVKTLKPLRDRGRNLLMLDENMWAYIPNLKRSLRVSLAQKLTGQTANGDISRTRWHGDYTAQIEKSDSKTWTLYLKANKKGLTYDRIRVWIQKNTFRPLKAEFLAPSNKILKKVTYQNYKKMAGKIRPTEIFIQDGLRAAEHSTLKIISMKNKKLPSSLFHQRNLK